MMRKKGFKVIGGLCLIGALFGCSESKKPEPAAKELTKASSKAVDLPESEILKTAERHYESGLFSVAKESFESLKDSYPVGPYAELADLKIGDCLFESQEYADAAKKYNEFIRTYPTSPSLSYVMYRAGRSEQLQNRDFKRDINPVERGLEWYERVLKEFPESAYAESAREAKREALSVLAAHEGFVAQFYGKRGELDGAVESRLTAQEERLKAAALMPASKEMKLAAGNVTQREPLEVVALRRLPSQKAPGGTELPPSDSNSVPTARAKMNWSKVEEFSPAQGRRVEKIECTTDTPKKVFIYLSSPLSTKQEEEARKSLRLSGSVLSFVLPETTSSPRLEQCFSPNDLSISPGGLVALGNLQKGGQIMALNSPPRVLVLLQ